MTPQPAWAAVFPFYFHLSALLLALVLPFLRAGLRKFRNAKKAFVTGLVIHDAFAGVALPSFIALCLVPMFHDIITVIDPDSMVLAGILGIIYTAAEVFGTEHIITRDSAGTG